MTTETAPARTVARPRSATPVRREIQALRAIAVLGVLIFHLWPGRLSGGYVGVDVFFVVSGYLISDHLLRGYARDGRVSLARFWARRIRRLLPASLLVLLVTAGAVWLWAPDSRWAQFGGEIIASALYVENWALAAQSVDYMALSNVKSPVQHFWSLGVEEQFYVVWPLLIASAAILAGLVKLGRGRAITTALLLVTAASLAFSVYATGATPSIAYFSTFTRAWEFGAGALLAILLRRMPQPLWDTPAALVSWLGFAMVAVAMLTFDATTPFPGFTALLPVVGTVLVIMCGTPRHRLAPSGLMSLRPVQFVGDVSYGAYLWHWPIIVLLPYAIGAPLSLPISIAILVASIALGWASKMFVEDPVRTFRPLSSGRSRWSFAGAAVAMLVVVAAAFPLANYTVEPPVIPTAEAELDCYGANAMFDAQCGPVDEFPLAASLSSFAMDVPPADVRGCEMATTAGDYRRCDFGEPGQGGPRVALIGDSHGTRMVEPLRNAVLAEGGTLDTFLVSGCSMMSRELTGSAWGFEEAYGEQCRDVSTRVHDEVAADPDIDVVVLTNRTRLYVTDRSEFHPLTTAMVADSINQLTQAGKRVVVLKDPPEMNAVPPQGGGSAADCLANASSPQECALPRAEADFADPMVEAARQTGVPAIDLDDAFCTSEACLARIGGLVVYSDDNHLTRSYAHSLTELIGARLKESLNS